MAVNNQVTLIGNLGADLELKGTQDKPYTQFRLAVSDKKGEEEITHWIWISVFGYNATNLVATAKKGTRLVVIGKLQVFSQEVAGQEYPQERVSVVANSVSADLSFATAEITRTPRAGGGGDHSAPPVDDAPAAAKPAAAKPAAAKAAAGAPKADFDF